jgi:plastocyanin
MERLRGRRRLLALAMTALVAWPLASARAASTTVAEEGRRFVEAQVEVTVGDTVTWVYRSSPGNAGHTVTFEDPTLNADGRFTNCPGTILSDDCQRSSSPPVSRTFNRVGTFPYYCKLHRPDGMAGVVVVSAKVTTTTLAATTSSTLARATTTSSTAKSASTSSTTATTRPLSTSSTLVKSTTTTAESTSVLLPGDAPSFDDTNSSAAGKSGGSEDGGDSGTVALIVALLLTVGLGGGFLLWRLRPGRA